MIAKDEVSFKRIAIYTHNKPEKEKDEIEFLGKLLKFCEKHDVETVSGDVRTVSLLKNKISLIDDDQRYDLKIGIGGDGTLLKMMRTLQKKGREGLLLGINFGTLGFLSELKPETVFEDLERIFQGQFHIDSRMLIKAFVWRAGANGEKEKAFRAYALNDIVFGHGGLARLTNYHVTVNRRILSTFRSDGLIFATPTGSTAYSLSVGGPIIMPNLSSVLLTPVAPHTLSHRPLVLPSKKIFHLTFEGRFDAISMTIDGQVHFTLKPTDEVTIQAATRRARFIRMKKSHYFRTLRNKLGWGDKR